MSIELSRWAPDGRIVDGVDMREQYVLHATRMTAVQERIACCLEFGWTLVGAEPLPSKYRDIAEVLFRLALENEVAGFLVVYSAATKALLYVSDVYSVGEALTETVGRGFGRLPFAMATKSYSDAVISGTDRVLYEAIDCRRSAYTDGLRGFIDIAQDHRILYASSHTTNSSTNNITNQSKSVPTNGLTTPNDMDPFSDPSSDPVSDPTPDPTSDPDPEQSGDGSGNASAGACSASHLELLRLGRLVLTF
jgi:hypothetical protein